MPRLADGCLLFKHRRGTQSVMPRAHGLLPSNGPALAKSMAMRLFFLGLSLTIAVLEAFSTPPDGRTESWPLARFGSIEGPAECTKQANELAAAVMEFDESARDHVASYGPRAGVRSLDRILQELKAGKGEGCYPWITGYYAIYSLSLYVNYRAASERKELQEIARLLYRRRRLSPLEAGRWGDALGEKIYGAYQCEESRVYFDATLRPYDLGAVLAHELDHFVRDKTFYWDDPDTYARDVSTALLLDESLAVLHSGFLQLSFKRDRNRSSEEDAGKKVNFKHFFTGNPADKFRYIFRGTDLTLFSPRGNLRWLWEREISKSGFPPDAAFPTFLDRIAPAENDADGARHLRAILDIVSAGYFESRGPSVDAALAALPTWNEKGSYGDSKRLEERLESPSPGCRRISAAIRAGEIPTYVGSRLGGAKPKSGEGVRTDDPDVILAKPLMPCLKPDERI